MLELSDQIGFDLQQLGKVGIEVVNLRRLRHREAPKRESRPDLDDVPMPENLQGSVDASVSVFEMAESLLAQVGNGDLGFPNDGG